MPPGQYIQLKIRQKAVGGTAYIATFSAASAPKPDKSSKPFAKELIVPYWFVRSTGDKERANMHYTTMKCTVAITAGKEEANDEHVLIPILQNLKPLKEGDELLIYHEVEVKTFTIEPAAAESAPKPHAPATSQSPKKRAAVIAPKRLHQPPQKKAMKRK